MTTTYSNMSPFLHTLVRRFVKLPAPYDAVPDFETDRDRWHAFWDTHAG